MDRVDIGDMASLGVVHGVRDCERDALLSDLRALTLSDSEGRLDQLVLGLREEL